MLISLSMENWTSFKNEATFSMVATKERQHGERVPKIKKHQMRLLPIAALYGGNASGKTNLCRALHFAKNLVTKGTPIDGAIPVAPFLLDPARLDQPCRFKFEILIEETIYEFSFAATSNAIVEESLKEISGAKEKALYVREGGKINFAPSLNKDQFLNFAFKGTRNNQLFLTNSVDQNTERFKPIYDWFNEKLIVIDPNSRFNPLEDFWREDDPLFSNINKLLKQLDTGIEFLRGEEMSFKSLPFSENFKKDLERGLPEGLTYHLHDPEDGSVFSVSRQRGALTTKKLRGYHRDVNGKETPFELRQEAEGSQRLLDVLPAFVNLASGSNEVYVIDELDRSLHTLLTRQLLESYLASCSHQTRSQLIFTTHDVLLMDQDLLRRDEMWVTERGEDGASKLYSFSEYKDVRYDKDIRKSYLQGRLGGVPRILLNGSRACQERPADGPEPKRPE